MVLVPWVVVVPMVDNSGWVGRVGCWVGLVAGLASRC